MRLYRVLDAGYDCIMMTLETLPFPVGLVQILVLTNYIHYIISTLLLIITADYLVKISLCSNLQKYQWSSLHVVTVLKYFVKKMLWVL